MRGILATFLQDHPPASAIDDTTKKERSIVRLKEHLRSLDVETDFPILVRFFQIETLYQRSVQLLRKDSGSVNNSLGLPIHDEAAHARTLLGLSAASSSAPTRSASMHSQPSPRKQAMGLPGGGVRPPVFMHTSHQEVYAGQTTTPTSPATHGWMSSQNRASETPPSMEDDSAQHLLDHFWNENLVLDTVVRSPSPFRRRVAACETDNGCFPMWFGRSATRTRSTPPTSSPPRPLPSGVDPPRGLSDPDRQDRAACRPWEALEDLRPLTPSLECSRPMSLPTSDIGTRSSCVCPSFLSP